MPHVFLRWLLALLVAGAAPAFAQKVPDVGNTKHNLSASGPGTVKATTESQICVFCHTPHAAEAIPNAPLWNRKLSAAPYTTYASSSIEASTDELSRGPGGTSRLCLSCHDGTMAIGSVNVLNGKANQTIAMGGTTTDGKMPSAGMTTGFTRNLGVNLTNDHPISFTYDTALAASDGELRDPAADNSPVKNRVRGQAKPKLPLENNQIQCSTCHDPHLKEQNPVANGVAKFLRLNRFQKTAPAGGAFSENDDIFCLACHDKAGKTWAYSAHAHPGVADEEIDSIPASQREFPQNLPVWRAACLACHDTHSVEGSRRLLREGTDSTATPKAGGGSAIEETCYQCHSATGETILKNVTSVPNIKTEFNLAVRMPIRTSDQRSGGEAHDIGTGTGAQRGKDFYEDPAKLGKQGNLQNRHVECTDCHNPHRVVKKRLFNADPTIVATGDVGTHNHAAGHNNIASGVLRGSYGVEPIYGSKTFGSPASRFDVKRGDGGVGTIASATADKPYVTREYQVCLKCHSSYAYDKPPALGSSGNGTPSGTNFVIDYTDQAMEFQAPDSHRARPAAGVAFDSGAYKGPVRVGCATPATACGTSGCTCYNVDYQQNNHRSWHPVINSTGRTHTLRNTNENSWRAPWNLAADVGSQTMYCSDCHGGNTRADSVDPNCPEGTGVDLNACGENGRAWGPHGSENAFLLKGNWGSNVGSGGTGAATNALCFKCHTPATYSSTSGGGSTGFNGGGRGNLHQYHREKLNRIRCTWCHVAVPHGWKNKAFLVNLNDVGPEAGEAPGTQVRNNTRAAYTKGPYYVNAVLKIRTFGVSGSWSETNCGSAGTPGNGQTGRDWMRDSSEACTNAP